MRSISRRDGHITITLPDADAQTLQVALAPVMQGQTTSKSTDDLRQSLIRGIARALDKGTKRNA